MKNIRSETNEELVIPQYAFFDEESLMWFGLEFRVNDYNRWHIRTSSFWSFSTEIQLMIEQALEQACSSRWKVLCDGKTQIAYIGNIRLEIRAFRFQ